MYGFLLLSEMTAFTYALYTYIVVRHYKFRVNRKSFFSVYARVENRRRSRESCTGALTNRWKIENGTLRDGFKGKNIKILLTVMNMGVYNNINCN